MMPVITYAIIAITVLTSLRAFNDPVLRHRMLFNPYLVRRGDYIRIVASAFIHADYMHLFVNMYVLYAFGQWVEAAYSQFFGTFGGVFYVVLYTLGIVASDTVTYLRQKDNPGYNSLGASGAVSAVLFAAILLYPDQRIYFLFLPGLGIPAWLFGGLYLAYSQYMARRDAGRINHDAHFGGAVFGFFFTGLLKPALFLHFIQMITP